MSTDEAIKLLKAQNRGETDKYVFIDIREPAEQVIGSLRGATMVRFPDLKIANLDLTGKKVILFCHNGNRSSAAAEAMVKMGIDAAFVVGGLEKLVVEGRETTGISVRNIAELRSIPNYTNRNTLLDTAQVKGLIDKDRAIFVDIRSSTDFSASHIPGAINLNFSRMTTGVMSEQIAQLPKRPIILPCYDRHGCFFADIAGYELSRAGHDVRGRYTLPWEYFDSRGRPLYVEAWLAEQNKNIAAKMANYLAGFMFLVSQWTGVVAAILLLAALSRLLVLPFSLKAERDQIRARFSADEMAQLKSRLKDDPVRRTRAIRGFYKRHGMTPGRNLLALAFLPVMAVALLAVQELAIRSKSKFLWIDHLALRDPLYVLPVVFGVLITLYVDIAFATKAKHRVFIWLMVLPTMVAVGLTFGAASNIYLIGSAVLLLTQRLWVDGKFAAAVRAWRRRALPNGVIPLEAVSSWPTRETRHIGCPKCAPPECQCPTGYCCRQRFWRCSQKARPKPDTAIWSGSGIGLVASGLPSAVRPGEKTEPIRALRACSRPWSTSIEMSLNRLSPRCRHRFPRSELAPTSARPATVACWSSAWSMPSMQA